MECLDLFVNAGKHIFNRLIRVEEQTVRLELTTISTNLNRAYDLLVVNTKLKTPHAKTLHTFGNWKIVTKYKLQFKEHKRYLEVLWHVERLRPGTAKEPNSAVINKLMSMLGNKAKLQNPIARSALELRIHNIHSVANQDVSVNAESLAFSLLNPRKRERLKDEEESDRGPSKRVKKEKDPP
jgi:hypothetical protein